VDDRIHATLKPASWVSVEVRFQQQGDEPVSDVWAAEPQLHRVQQAELVPAADTFITPGEMRRFRETAEAAVRTSAFVMSDSSGEHDARALVSFYWRFGARGTVDLYGIAKQFRRDQAILVDNADGRPVVVLLSGPTRDYKTDISEELTEDELLATRGIPADRLIAPNATRCGILEGLPDDVVRGETADVAPVVVETSRVRPDYPEQARIYRTGGTVTLDVMLDDQGAVVGVVVKRAVPGFPSFARSVIDGVCRLRYLPAIQAGTPAPSIVEYNATFELR
jgi:TonB family protein